MSDNNGAHVEATAGTGTPPVSPNFGIPRYSGADPADYPTQTNAITDIVDAQMARRAAVRHHTAAAVQPSRRARVLLHR